MVHQELPLKASGFARHYVYDDTDVFALDFGAHTVIMSFDIVDGTALIVAQDKPEEVDIELPNGTVDVTTNNGIVTIEVTQE